MDPLTHTLLGGGVAYALGHRTLGRTAAAVGVAAGLLPDADVFLRSATDPLFAVEMHRGFSHALPFAPVGAAIAAAPWLLRRAGRAQAGALWGVALAAYVSHILLDAATSYGTRMFWPFSDVRVGWDYVAVVDPAVTLPLLVALVWSLFRASPTAVRTGLAIVVTYLGLGALQRARVAEAQERVAAARGHTLERREIMPTLGNLFVWRTLYLEDGKIHSDRIRVGLSGQPTFIAGWALPEVTEADLRPEERPAAAHRDSFRRFRHFSGAWVGRSPDDPTVLGDMRYSLSTAAFDPIWGIRLGASGDPLDVAWVNRSTERRVSPGEMWTEIVGADARYQPLPIAVTAGAD